MCSLEPIFEDSNLPQGEGVRHFVFLPDGRLIGEYDGLTGSVVREYIWMDERLAGTVDAAGTLQFLQTGPLGQPLIVMNASGLVIWRGELAPFGELVSSAFGPVPEARFLGQWDEAGSGLYQNWHRTYDASLGRYLEADPLGLAAGQSLYGYAGQDPVNAVDPEGLLFGSGAAKGGGKSRGGGFGRAGAAGAAAGMLAAYLGAINKFQDDVPGFFKPGGALDDMREEIERLCRPLITPWPVLFSPPVTLPLKGDPPGGGRRKPSKREMACHNTAAMAGDGDRFGHWNSYCNREPMPYYQTLCKGVAFEKEEQKHGYCSARFET